MKNKRQYKILDIIKMHDVETQEMLQNLLSDYGFNVTQATVSRDIKELKLIKKNNKKRNIQNMLLRLKIFSSRFI